MITVFKRQGWFSKLGNKIPMPVKIFSGISLAAGAAVWAPPPLLILGAPPLFLLTFLRHKYKTNQKIKVNEMHNQRWRDLASFHLKGETIPNPDFSQGRVPIPLQAAIEQSELSGLGQISIGKLRMMLQDMKLNDTGSQEMMIYEYPLFINTKERGIIRIVAMRESHTPNENNFRIEYEMDGKIGVLKNHGSHDQIIENSSSKHKS